MPPERRLLHAKHVLPILTHLLIALTKVLAIATLTFMEMPKIAKIVTLVLTWVPSRLKTQ
jgi:hypothetical protein